MQAKAAHHRRPIWLIALVVLLLAWALTLAGVTLVDRSPHTGDILLDLYLRIPRDSNGQISRAEWDKLTSLWEGDPRIWEISLRPNYQLDSLNRLEQLRNYIATAQKEHWKISPSLVTSFVVVQDGVWADELPGASQHSTQSQQTKLPQDVRDERALLKRQRDCSAIDNKHRAERDRNYALLEKVAGQYSYTWYLKARLALDRNDYAGALRCIERSNAARHNSMMLPYPLPQFVKALRTNGPIASVPQASTLCGELVAAELPNFISIKNLHFGLWRHAQAAKDVEAMNALHQYACRLGMSNDGGVINVLVALVLLKYEYGHVSKKTGLTPQQQHDLTLLYNHIDKVKSDARNIGSNSPFKAAITNQTLLSQLREKLQRSYYAKLELKSMQWEQQQLVTKIFPQLRDIATFDFQTLTFPPAGLTAAP